MLLLYFSACTTITTTTTTTTTVVVVYYYCCCCCCCCLCCSTTTRSRWSILCQDNCRSAETDEQINVQSLNSVLTWGITGTGTPQCLLYVEHTRLEATWNWNYNRISHAMC